ncbi:MAG: hypothetical protein KDD94_14670 [Calditrichaeota bacterium]|nr:hypothetical protein [Calditrichota bacterium]
MKLFSYLCALLLFVYACDQIDELLGGTAAVSIKVPRSMPNKLAKKSNHVIITEIKILVDRLKFHSANEDSIDFDQGPFIVVLDSNLTFAQISSTTVPAGSYHKVSFKIHKPDPGEVVADTAFTTGDRYSLIVKGKLDTIDFEYKISKTITQQIFIDPILTVNDEGSYNATLFVNTDEWFVDGQNDLDPREPMDSIKIENNIKASFRAYKDNNKDGIED